MAAYQVSRSLTDEKTKQREINGLLDALRTYNLPAGIILTLDEEATISIEEKEIRVIPLWKWLLGKSQDLHHLSSSRQVIP